MTEAPKELYFYDDWLVQHTKGKLLCGNNRYLHESHVDAMLKAEREKALREAAEVCERIREQKINGPMPERACFDYEQSIRALAEKE